MPGAVLNYHPAVTVTGPDLSKRTHDGTSIAWEVLYCRIV